MLSVEYLSLRGKFWIAIYIAPVEYIVLELLARTSLHSVSMQNYTVVIERVHHWGSHTQATFLHHRHLQVNHFCSLLITMLHIIQWNEDASLLIAPISKSLSHDLIAYGCTPVIVHAYGYQPLAFCFWSWSEIIIMVLKHQTFFRIKLPCL